MSATEDPNGVWTTWEELLLAFAVNRHGTNSWESIAVEIQSRTSSPLLLNANNCRQKYDELQRRFTAADEKSDGPDDESEENGDNKIPWLDQLRKLRVAELRREVHQYDVSIVSLQSKVEKLKEERERSSRETDDDDDVGKPDLVKNEAENEREAEKSDYGEVKRSKRDSAADSDRENQSFNESNSTGSKNRDPEIGTVDEERKADERFSKPEPEAEVEAAAVPDKPDPAVPGESPAEEAVGEGSYNGSSDTIAKGAVVSSAAKSPVPVSVPEVGESAEFHESVAESNGGEERLKENSDVQSSASLSKKRNRKRPLTGSSSGEEPEADEVSKRISVKSHPLVGFLEIIRSHKHGSFFERRLEIQETAHYHSIVRQHLDLEMVRSKLEEGLYSDRSPEFFRDLLLLFNNAAVFFPKNSPESVAAFNLREIVSKEIRRSFPKPSPPSKEPPPLPPPQPSVSLPKPAPEPPNSSQGKPNPSAPIIATGKRTSSSSAKSQLAVQTAGNEKPVVTAAAATNSREPERSPANLGAVEARVTKKRTRERSSSAARGARTSSTRSNGPVGTRVSNPILTPSSNGNAAANAAGSNDNSEGRSEKKSANSAVVAKKRSAANFLNRMRSSTSTERTLLDSLKNPISNGSSGGGGGMEQKKKGGRGDGRRESSLRQGSSGKQAEGQRSPATKRSVGRPPKRTPPPVQTSSRRAKETVAKQPPRKRARR